MRRRPSPNHGPRPAGVAPSLVVIHYTDETDAEAALRILCDPARAVSSHYLVGADGAVWQLVDEDRRAWHAGEGAWGAVTNVNDHSIGVELDNDGASDYAEPLMAATEALLAGILARHRIPPRGVIGHADLAPGRKRDPGPLFPWRRLAAKGLAVWPDPPLVPGGDVWGDLRRLGYPVTADEDGRRAVLTAFRDRFRAGADGPLDAVDASLAATLVARYALDPTPFRA